LDGAGPLGLDRRHRDDGARGPVRGVVAVLLTQRMMAGAHDGPEDFWTAVAGSATVEP